MNRRELVTLLCVAAVSGTATAQTRRNIPLIGILSTHPATNAHMLDALRQGLRALGYVERESINVEIRWTEGHPERIPELIAELVGLNPDALRTH
jgi:putative ABC transport system substrate-binding protein